VARREQALKVEIPTSDADRLKLGRVGLLAFGGFVLGIAWPRLAGVTLVPSPPLDEQTQAAAEPPADESAAPAAAAPPASAAAAPVAPAPPPTADVLVVQVGKATITSCRDARGRTEQCGAADFDSVLRAPLEALSGCRAAGGARGTLSLGFEVDFENKKISDLKSGKSTTLGNQTTGALTACAKERLDTVKLDGVAHDHPEYTVYYSIEISPNEGQTAAAAAEPTSAATSEGDIVAASGRATVSWQVALIRAEPKEGEVVARVLNGTRVVVTGRKGEWYRVKYDAKGNEGWVYRTAIGL
jgi:hypothetical protein